MRPYVPIYIYACHIFFSLAQSPGELSEDMETSSETTAGPLDQTKDSCNLGVQQISEETGRAAS